VCAQGVRKVILATNIAETSITIGGVRFVVDPGLVKMRGYSAKTGVESLVVTAVSQAHARQVHDTPFFCDYASSLGRAAPSSFGALSDRSLACTAHGPRGTRGAWQVLPPVHGGHVRRAAAGARAGDQTLQHRQRGSTAKSAWC
jgi:hypothetical protein